MKILINNDKCDNTVLDQRTCLLWKKWKNVPTPLCMKHVGTYKPQTMIHLN